jgi:hypothetical protein
MLSRLSTGRSLAVLLALVFLPAIAMAATPLPGGSPIHVNVSHNGRHFQPPTAVFTDGGFVVVWSQGAGQTDIYARLLTSP